MSSSLKALVSDGTVRIGEVKRACVKTLDVPGSEKEEYVSQLSRTTRKLAHLKLNLLQAEILRELLIGERTVTELTFTIFHSDYQDKEFEVYHGRVRRAVKSLEKKGFIARRSLFGREKPYKLTQYGGAKVLSIIPDMSEPAIFVKKDLVFFVLVPVVGVVAWLTLHHIWTNFFSLILGMALFRAAQIVKKVM